MASSCSGHVSNDDLLSLAKRLQNVDKTKLGGILGLDAQSVTRMTKEGTARGAFDLLSVWSLER